MKLYFLRHGVAGDPGEWQGRDFDRPLTREGVRRMEREAKTFADLGLDPDVVLTSPLVRAKQTADIAAGALKAHVVADERLGPDFNASRLAELLKEHSDSRSLMLVGHEPNMSETIGQIVGGAKIDLKKGGLVLVDVADPNVVSGVLVWLISPKVLLL
jgi:phosphohistidine phosphatase